MVASGFAGLGYQIVWTQQCALWLGHETAALLAVVTAFFGGLAVGAWTLGGRIEASARPRRWYAGCELVVALWSLLLIFAMRPVSGGLLSVTGVRAGPVWQWCVAFAGTFLLLAPATVAMGATLPAMERLVAGETRSVAALYAGNTFGAMTGVLVTAFWWIPAWGLARTAASCVTLNLLCAGASLVAFPSKSTPPASPTRALDRLRARGALARLAATGLLGIGYEVLVVRVLSQVAEDTVYTFAILLAVYLVGTAAGAAAYARWLRAPAARDVEGLDGSLPAALAAVCLVGTATLWAAARVEGIARHTLGGTMAGGLAAEALPALLAFGPATLVMGALFSHLGRRAHEAGVSFGRALGVNTLGAAAAPVVFGVLLLPAVGPKLALLLIVVGYVALVPRRAWARPLAWLPAGGAVVCALALGRFAPPLAFVDVPAGGRVVRYEDGVEAAVSVVEDGDGVARLRIDNREQEGSSATRRVDARQAWLPLLLHPAPRAALFLGLGTGVTAFAAATDPALDVDAVELLPEVIRASASFARAAARAPRLIAADARRFVRASARRYDVIVSDNFHPARSGSGALYTVGHFEAVRLRLETGGMFCQWLPLHQLDLPTLRSLVRSFLAAFPDGAALLANNSLETPVLGLVGGREATRFDVAAVRARLARGAGFDQGFLAGLGLEDELAVLGSFVADAPALGRFAANADTNTDDRPVVAYRAPRVTYAPEASPGQRLVDLLRELSIEPGRLLSPDADARDARRLAAYWRARDLFIEAGRDVRPAANVQTLLAQVRAPLLSVLRLSPDFRPAYDPLLAMASALSGSDAPAARALLDALARLQPARPEAPRALAALER